MDDPRARIDQSITLTIPPPERVKGLLLCQRMQLVSSQPVHIILVTGDEMEPLFRTYPKKVLYTLAPGIRKLVRHINPLLNVLHVVKSSVSPRFFTAICDWLIQLCVADRERFPSLALELLNGDITEAVNLWRTFEFMNIKIGMDRLSVYLRSIFVCRPLNLEEFQDVLQNLPLHHTTVNTLLEEQTKHKIRNQQTEEHEAILEWITAHHPCLRERLCEIRAAHDPKFGLEWEKTKPVRYVSGRVHRNHRDCWKRRCFKCEKKRQLRKVDEEAVEESLVVKAQDSSLGILSHQLMNSKNISY